ncbi:hypothetical protein RA272_30425, partial [Pseudomonas syringae pv. tagetis]|uniref:hypothetical protein n=1 Tax=Pseudomonas syringae group genomosp. 7 TaxID=251699 RepID=UPI0037705C22
LGNGSLNAMGVCTGAGADPIQPTSTSFRLISDFSSDDVDHARPVADAVVQIHCLLARFGLGKPVLGHRF